MDSALLVFSPSKRIGWSRIFLRPFVRC